MNSEARTIQSDRHWHATQCACGRLTLQLGPIRIAFTRDEFARLHRLVQEAMTQFQIEPSGTDVRHVHGLTH